MVMWQFKFCGLPMSPNFVFRLNCLLAGSLILAVSWWPPTSDAGFDPGPINVEFLMDKSALGKASLQAYQFYPVSVIPAVLLSYIAFTQIKNDCQALN